MLLRTAAFSPDDRLLACGSDDAIARIWNLAAPVSLLGHTGPVDAIAFDRKGERLATGSRDRAVRIWDPLHPATPLRVIQCGTGAVRTLTFDADGAFLIVACNESLDKPEWSAAMPGPKIAIPRGFLYCYDLSPDRQNFAPIQMPGNFPEITCLALSPDGVSLAAGCTDMSIHFWIASPAALVSLAEASAGRNLTAAEWETFVSHGLSFGYPYQSTVSQLP